MGRTDTLTRTHQAPPRSVFVFAMAQVDVIGPGSTLQRSIVFPTKEKIIMTSHFFVWFWRTSQTQIVCHSSHATEVVPSWTAPQILQGMIATYFKRPGTLCEAASNPSEGLLYQVQIESPLIIRVDQIAQVFENSHFTICISIPAANSSGFSQLQPSDVAAACILEARGP